MAQQDWPWADHLDLEPALARARRQYDDSGSWFESGFIAALALVSILQVMI